MKLRIRGDSIRLRLTKEEVKKIGDGSAVQETTHFIDGNELNYLLLPDDVSGLRAEFVDRQIVVRVPRETSREWAQTDRVEMKHEVVAPKAAGAKLFVLIEKDFACLKVRENENEDESILFENPNKAHGACR